MNYRALSKDELEPLRADFIEYLAANGMAGDDWKRILENDPVQSKLWMEQFSHVVWAKSLPKIKAVELRLKDTWTCIKIGESEMDMIRLVCSDPILIQFDDPLLLAKLAAEADNLLINDAVEIVKGSKKMTSERNDVVYELLEQGFVAISEVVYRALLKSISAPQ